MCYKPDLHKKNSKNNSPVLFGIKQLLGHNIKEDSQKRTDRAGQLEQDSLMETARNETARTRQPETGQQNRTDYSYYGYSVEI
jgi:hypothetical protein